MITLIAACDQNGAIGRDGSIPWDLPEDLKSFQRETLGGAIIMGRKTWESLPVRPLARRLNIVVSNHPETADLVADSVENAVSLALKEGYLRIYGIGGARIYADLLPVSDRLLISEVEVSVSDADTFFPQVDWKDWRLANEAILRSDGPRCFIREWLRY